MAIKARGVPIDSSVRFPIEIPDSRMIARDRFRIADCAIVIDFARFLSLGPGTKKRAE